VKRIIIVSALAALGTSSSALATGTSSPYQPDFAVIPFEMNNGRKVVVAEWRDALGCPGADPIYGCAFPDMEGVPNDPDNEGLLLSKTYATADPSAAGADLKGVRGVQIYELGYDLRKPLDFAAAAGASGSHCGPRSPRFEITTKNRQGQTSTSYMFVDRTGDGCTLPPPVQEGQPYWLRLRWGGTSALMACATNDPVACSTGSVVDITGQRVERIRIVFDEGPDAPSPDQFALSVLDNIDVNGKLVGSGPQKSYYDDEDHGQGQDDKGHSCKFRGSSSHPESTEFNYDDSSSNEHVQGVNGARSITYSTGPLGEKCVNIAGDALVNGKPGYLYNFVACDLWTLAGFGTFSMSVTGGPLGSLPYQAANTMTSGYVSIHDQ
jgi:hypothetical protein